ncbi:unnamed protein product [Sphenostylis stenocarpa]|uniref:Uncharacterized protein n=1 Tax=Sphenostylis stenocarpa TaxID=92480 RepID=A0AA86SN26_9FABA|nr:unnamed protein product [Sphenostylis stenocarpa]
MSWEGGRRSGLLGSTVKRMMFVHARLMKFDRVLLIDRYRLTSRKIRHEKEVQHEDFPGEMGWEGGRRSGLLGSMVKRMMFVHARLMKFDRVLLIDRYRLTSRKIRHEKEVQYEDFPGGHPS